MVAGLSKLAGRASYKTPRIRGQQVEEVARLALAQSTQTLAPIPELAQHPTSKTLLIARAGYRQIVDFAGSSRLRRRAEVLAE